MEKILSKMPGAEDGAPKASVILEINKNHRLAQKLDELYEVDKEKLKKYARLMYLESCLIGGIAIDNPTELVELITELM
jgi:molecular chaperone HtpG